MERRTSTIVMIPIVMILCLVASLATAVGRADAEPSEAAPGDVWTFQSELAVGWNGTCAITADGALRCWGEDGSGRFGDALVTVGDDEVPASVPPLDLISGREARAVTVGDLRACAITTEGSVHCWPSPDLDVDLGSGRTAVDISAGFDHVCAVLDDGTVRCWGTNPYGLGYGGQPDGVEDPGAQPPIDLGPGRTATAVAAGRQYSCAILDTGDVRCWGQGEYSQLGLNNTRTLPDPPFPPNVSVPGSQEPIDLGAGRTAEAISAGDRHTCAILDDGSVLCWGTDGLGYPGVDIVGDDETPGAMGPVDLGPGRTAIAITAGGRHTCALLDDHTVRCWGTNDFGQLGRGDAATIGDDETPGSVPPVDLGTGRTAVAVSAGIDHTCATLDDGTVRCWGGNAGGQLGLGHTLTIGDDETAASVPTVDVGAAMAVVPGEPASVVAFAGDGSATVAFAPPAVGSGPFTYVVTVTPGGRTIDSPSSPVVVDGLDNGSPYTFTVQATDRRGLAGPASPGTAPVVPAPGAPGPPEPPPTEPPAPPVQPIDPQAPVRRPTDVMPPPDPGDVRNCTDFTTWAEANAWFWTYAGYWGDVGQLDVDGDLIPCETIPGAPVTAQLPAVAYGAGYWMLEQDGDVYSFGDAWTVPPRIPRQAVAMAAAPAGGYWVLTEEGTVEARMAPHHGNLDAAVLSAGEHPTALAGRPDGTGYWIFTDRGRAIAFGSAQNFGDMSGSMLNGAVIAAVATPSGNGYWMVGSDGGIFSFGDAQFWGSTGDLVLNRPVVGMAADPDGSGYWLVAADGGIFAFAADFRGSVPGVLAPGQQLNRPVVGALSYGTGYVMVAADGGIFSFSDLPFLGSLGASPPDTPVLGVAVARR